MTGRGVGTTMYSTCPRSRDVARAEYAGRVAEVARWSEDAGCRGMFVYTDNGLVDPWVVAQHVLSATSTLRPLVAVQPVYMHPYTVAKLVASIAHLYGRAVDLNLVAGGTPGDLLALADDSPYEDRYERLVEYATIVERLVGAEEPLEFEGRHYRVTDLRLDPPVPEELRPRLLVSGASDACRDAARAVGAVSLTSPRPLAELEPVALDDVLERGIRVGIIARSHADDAWAAAHVRFPDTARHRNGDRNGNGGNPYWTWPAKAHGTYCPYLVGTHDRVSVELAGYLGHGVRTVVTDTPLRPEDLVEAQRVVELAANGIADS